MTDAATKNLKVEAAVSETLGTEHIPLHILCKSHTCEKFDEGCLHALIKVEQQSKMSELISKRQPQLKSFIRQNKCIAKSTLTALLKLVSGEESGKPISCKGVQSGIGRTRIDEVLKPVQRKGIHKVGILRWFSL